MHKLALNCLTMLLAVTLLNACSGGRDSAALPQQQVETATLPVLRQLDALGNTVATEPGLRLEVGKDGVISLLAGSPRDSHSLYLEFSLDADGETLRAELAPELRERALLISQALPGGRLAVGLTMRGSGAMLPEGELLELRRVDADRTLLRELSAISVVPVDDIYFEAPDFATMHWTYFGNGDYDQNGIVNISDITPVGQYFQADSSSEQWQRERVADGDRNLVVNISDITPIGVNYETSVDGFVILSSSSPTGPWTPLPDVYIPYSAGVLPAGGGPRVWSYALVNPPYGQYYVVAPSDGELTSEIYGTPGRFLPDNIPPAALGYHDGAPQLLPGTLVSFDAADSYDPDGTIDHFEWDPEGNGQWVNTLDVPNYTYTYTGLGSFQPYLRVTDEEGAFSVLELNPLNVSFGALTTSSPDAGQPAHAPLSAALDSEGRPVLSFIGSYQDAFSVPYIIRAKDPDAGSWHAPQMALISPTPCDQFSLASSGGILWAYLQHGEKLCIERFLADNSGGIEVVELIDDHPSLVTGYQPFSFDMFDTPAVAWLEDAADGSGPLRFTSSFLDYAAQDVDQLACFRPSALLLPTGPALLYGRDTGALGSDLVYRRSSNISGGEWLDARVLVSGRTVSSSARSMLLSDGRIVVAYHDEADQALYSITSADEQGGSWQEPVLIEDGCDSGELYGLALFNGLPGSVHACGGELRLALARDVHAGGWNPGMILLESRAGFGAVEVLVQDGRPLVFALDLDDDSLHSAGFLPTP
ncbi:hypothetical protein KDL44_03360 [bacterium]|nr:hypothetical protein [bacterium]